MERQIRMLKREALAQDAMGDKAALARSALKLQERTRAHKGFSNAVDIRPKLERLRAFGYDRSISGTVAQAQRFFDAINGTVTVDGISVTATAHLYGQARNRDISSGWIVNALTSPLDISPEKADDKGRISKQYIGEFATTSVNPQNGNATSCWPRSARKANKLKGGKES